MKKPICLLTMAWLSLTASAFAQAPPRPPQGSQSLFVSPEAQHEALLQIRDLADPAWKTVLQALKEGALYRWKGKLLVLDEDGILTEVGGAPLLDEAGEAMIPEEGLEQVPLAEDDTPLVQRALDFIDLFHAEPGVRRSVAVRLGNLRDVSVMPVLTKALTQENEPVVRCALEEAVNKLRLFDPEPPVRLRAVEFFAANRSESALALLKTLLGQEQDVAVREAASQAVARIERYLRFRNLVGYLFNGLSLSSILLVMSLGLAITFGLMGIINMAHGEMLMLGSYTAYVVQELFATHFPAQQDFFFIVALPLSLVVVGGVGFVLERGLLRFLYSRPLESLLVTWGMGMILQQGARLYFGDQTSVNPPAWFRGGWECLPGLILPYSRIFIIVLSSLCLLAVYVLLYRSVAGLKVRAVMQNRDMAACMGISTRRVDAFTFAFGTALAGLAGCALSLIGTVDPEVGKTYIVESFMVVVLGGVGKLSGTVLASFGIGMSNKLLEPAIGGTAAAVYAKVWILVLVIFFLQLKPTGLFPAKERATEAVAR